MLRQMLSLQARALEESQSSVRVAARSELQTFEFAQQQATIRAREDMVARLGAREETLTRARAELEVANFRTSAEAQSLARAREAEHRESVEAQRHREMAVEAVQMASRLNTKPRPSVH